MPAPAAYRDLCRGCLWLGLTAYGGPAMVGYVREVVVERRRWVGAKEFVDGLALCRVVPGAALTQVISCVGLLLRGRAGAATARFIFPCALRVLIVSALCEQKLSRRDSRISIQEKVMTVRWPSPPPCNPHRARP